MLETAYVLPLVLVVILFLVEVVAFAMNNFVANDVLADVHSAILSEVSDVSNLPAGDALDYVPKYASCDGGSVVLKDNGIGTLIKTSLEAIGVSFNADPAPSASITVTPVSGFNVYVINFYAVTKSLVLPDAFVAFFPVNVNTIISIKDSCAS